MNVNEDFDYKVNEVSSLVRLPQMRVNSRSKYKRYNKYFRNRKHKNDSVKHAEITQFSEYDWHVIDKYNYFNHIKVNDDYDLYSVPFQLSVCRCVCKNRTNKTIRHSNNVGNYSEYKKHFDYWNTIF